MTKMEKKIFGKWKNVCITNLQAIGVIEEEERKNTTVPLKK